MREGRKKEASKIKQTAKKSNTAHPCSSSVALSSTACLDTHPLPHPPSLIPPSHPPLNPPPPPPLNPPPLSSPSPSLRKFPSGLTWTRMERRSSRRASGSVSSTVSPGAGPSTSLLGRISSWIYATTGIVSQRYNNFSHVTRCHSSLCMSNVFTTGNSPVRLGLR